MNDKLQDLEQQISKSKKQRENISKSLEDLKALKAQKRAYQNTLILDGKDTTTVEAELLTFSVRENGFSSALATLDQTIAEDENERLNELTRQYAQSAKEVKNSVKSQTDESYLKLDTLLASLDDVDRKNKEYREFLQKAPAKMGDDDFITHVQMFVINLKRDLETLRRKYTPEDIKNR